MDKDSLRQLLKDYKSNIANRDRVKLDIERFDSRYKKVLDDYDIKLSGSYEINGDIRPKYKISDKVATAVIRRDKKLEKLKDERLEKTKVLDHYNYLIKTTETYLASLNDNDRAIVEARYIEGYSRDYIASSIYIKIYGTICSVENIDKIIIKAFNRMLK